jgi:dipeptidyl aminopeptidase/acylaminoacyl peptidase
MLSRSLAIILFSIGVAAFAETPTLEQSLSMKSVSNVEMSPDGKYVAYLVTQADWDENDFVSQVWLAVTATGTTYQLTSGRKSSMSPQWSPDSKRLAFISERDGKRQIYVISPSGGEAVQVTNEENGVNGMAWKPTEAAAIAYTSIGPDAKPLKDRKEKYGDFQVIDGDYRMVHLWLVKLPLDIPTNTKKLPKAEELTSGEQFSVAGFSWSPDGKRIAFSATSDPDLGSQDTEQLYILDASDLKVKKLLESGGPNSEPQWSPDGKQIAYVTSNGEPFFYFSNRYIATVPANGGTPTLLTSKFDEDAGLIDWGPDGIYFSARQTTYAHVFHVDPVSHEIRRVTGPDAFFALDASFSKDHKTFAGVGAAPNHFGEVFVSSVADFAPKYLTEMSAQWKDFQLGIKEVVNWKSGDGTTVEGILIKPANYDPARKYPLMVVIHGGPTGVDTPILAADRYYPVERFLAKGALILRPNYRGSAGYGARFRALNVRNLGLGDYADVISGVDSLIEKGLVDKTRVASMGWSEGGYISAFATTYSDRFKAISVGAGISDWTTYYVNTDIHPFTRQYLKATPWDDPEIYKKTSPITYVNQAKTPTLIQQGDQDKRVPPPNSYELYQALKDRNVPVKLIFYKGFGHPINKPKQQLAVMEHNYEWFGKYIWDDDAPSSVDAPLGERVVEKARGVGDQIYTCQSNDGKSQWALKAPEAELLSADGKTVGRHFAGPTWEWSDKSAVTGKMAASAASPNADSIPWLLVNVIRHDGAGALSNVVHVQRIHTKGGVAPESGCDESHVGSMQRVHYEADYVFYAKDK